MSVDPSKFSEKEVQSMCVAMIAFHEHATGCVVCRPIVSKKTNPTLICDEGLSILKSGHPESMKPTENRDGPHQALGERNWAAAGFHVLMAEIRKRYGTGVVLAILVPLIVIDIIGLYGILQAGGGQTPSRFVAFCTVAALMQTMPLILAEFPRLLWGRA